MQGTLGFGSFLDHVLSTEFKSLVEHMLEISKGQMIFGQCLGLQ